MYSMFDEVTESLNIKPEIHVCYPDFDIGTVYIYCTSYSIHMYIKKLHTCT